VHNHPSGDPKPSRDDIEMTREIKTAAEALGISIHDHLVIGRKGHASFRSLGLRYVSKARRRPQRRHDRSALRGTSQVRPDAECRRADYAIWPMRSAGFNTPTNCIRHHQRCCMTDLCGEHHLRPRCCNRTSTRPNDPLGKLTAGPGQSKVFLPRGSAISGHGRSC